MIYNIYYTTILFKYSITKYIGMAISFRDNPSKLRTGKTIGKNPFTVKKIESASKSNERSIRKRVKSGESFSRQDILNISENKLRKDNNLPSLFDQYSGNSPSVNSFVAGAILANNTNSKIRKDNNQQNTNADIINKALSVLQYANPGFFALNQIKKQTDNLTKRNSSGITQFEETFDNVFGIYDRTKLRDAERNETILEQQLVNQELRNTLDSNTPSFTDKITDFFKENGLVIGAIIAGIFILPPVLSGLGKKISKVF